MGGRAGAGCWAEVGLLLAWGSWVDEETRGVFSLSGLGSGAEPENGEPFLCRVPLALATWGGALPELLGYPQRVLFPVRWSLFRGVSSCAHSGAGSRTAGRCPAQRSWCELRTFHQVQLTVSPLPALSEEDELLCLFGDSPAHPARVEGDAVICNSPRTIPNTPPGQGEAPRGCCVGPYGPRGVGRGGDSTCAGGSRWRPTGGSDSGPLSPGCGGHVLLQPRGGWLWASLSSCPALSSSTVVRRVA